MVTPLLFALLLQDAEPLPEPAPPPPAPASPPPPTTFVDPLPAEPEPPPRPERQSEGRMLVTAYNEGIRFGISPGVVFVNGNAGFALGLRLGYGIDLDSVIVVPGIRLSGYFTDPNVYVGMPTFKLLLPIDRFAPFVEVGGGIGHVTDPSKSGFAYMGGGGFMIYFRHVALGAEVSYQAITGTNFKGIGFGPILALGF